MVTSPPPLVRTLLLQVLLAGSYGLTGWLSSTWLSDPSGVPTVWLPAGVISSAALLVGWRALPGLALGGALVGWLGFGGELAGPWIPCLTAAVISLLAPRLLRNKDVFSSAFSLLLFLAVAVLSFLIQALPLHAQVFQVLWGLLGGHLLFGPWLATCFRPHGQLELRASFSRESAAALLTVLAVGSLIASDVIPVMRQLPGISFLPVLLWASFRLPAPAATTIQVLAGLLFVLVHPSLAGNPDSAELWLVVRLAAGVVLMSQLVLAVTLERRRMQRHLERQAMRLRRLVRLRTQELAEANRRLTALSESDGLTGVANRRCFDQVFEHEWRRAQRRGESLTVGLIDVDFFKAYNDHYGHLQGDEVLQRVASALQGVMGRAEDLLARYGGEEFAVILPGLHRQEAAVMAERLKGAVAELRIPHQAAGDTGVISISGGLVALIPDPKSDRQQLLSTADQLLYAAKARGRNQVLVQLMALDDEAVAAVP